MDYTLIPDFVMDIREEFGRKLLREGKEDFELRCSRGRTWKVHTELLLIQSEFYVHAFQTSATAKLASFLQIDTIIHGDEPLTGFEMKSFIHCLYTNEHTLELYSIKRTTALMDANILAQGPLANIDPSDYEKDKLQALEQADDSPGERMNVVISLARIAAVATRERFVGVLHKTLREFGMQVHVISKHEKFRDTAFKGLREYLFGVESGGVDGEIRQGFECVRAVYERDSRVVEWKPDMTDEERAAFQARTAEVRARHGVPESTTQNGPAWSFKVAK